MKQVMDPRKQKRSYQCQHPRTKILSDGLAMQVEWCERCGSSRRIYKSSKGAKP